MSKTKFTALILLMFVIVSGMCTADGIKQRYSRYYDFAVSFMNASYGGNDEEILESDIGEPLEDATHYMAFRYKNKWCDCREVTEKDKASVYRDTECDDYSSIIVLTDTGTYIRAHFYRMLDYGSASNMDFGMVRDIFRLDNKKLEKVKVHEIYDGSWTMYSSFVLEKEQANHCDELLKIKYPGVNEPAHEGFESDFMLKITLFYSSEEQHIIGIDWSEHKLYAYGAWFGLTDEQYAEWFDALGLDESRF